MNASAIRSGDYIPGWGTVDTVRLFYTQKADKTKVGAMRGKFVPKQDAGKMARLIAEQQEQSYTEVLDTVFVRFYGGRTKVFQPDEVVNVSRISKAV
jgi:hypothetical protein